MNVRCYKKLMSAFEAERIEMFSTTVATKHENNVLNKMKIVNEVCTLKCKGLSKSAISRETADCMANTGCVNNFVYSLSTSKQLRYQVD